MKARGSRCLAMALAMLVAAGGGALAQEYPGREKLRAQSSEFRRDVIQVTEGVYVAVGYSASNVVLIQGDGGSIIVDTAADLVAARQIVEAFFARLRAPVRAIIYTHSHPDHTGGARAFARNDRPVIYSHQRLLTAAPDVGRAGRTRLWGHPSVVGVPGWAAVSRRARASACARPAVSLLPDGRAGYRAHRRRQRLAPCPFRW